MSDSILDTVKKMLNIESDNTAFDVDVIVHINSVFSTLNQLGVGPAAGFAIADKAATWADFLGDPEDPRLNNIKAYTYLKIKVIFDPPTGSYHLVNAINAEIEQLEWRISVRREDEAWVDPKPATVDPDNVQYVPIPVNDLWV